MLDRNLREPLISALRTAEPIALRGATYVVESRTHYTREPDRWLGERKTHQQRRLDIRAVWSADEVMGPLNAAIAQHQPALASAFLSVPGHVSGQLGSTRILEILLNRIDRERPLGCVDPIASVVDEFMSALNSRTVRCTLTAPLRGVGFESLTDVVHFPKAIVLRPTTGEEVSVIHRSAHPTHGLPDAVLIATYDQDFSLHAPGAGPELVDLARVHNLALQRAIHAMYTFKTGRVACDGIRHEVLGPLSGGVLTLGDSSEAHGNYTIASHEVSELERHARWLDGVLLWPVMEHALDLLVQSQATRTLHDSLVTAVKGLEVLFAQGANSDGVSKRFRSRYASLGPATRQERTATAKGIYAARSENVHEGRRPVHYEVAGSVLNIHQASVIAVDMLRETILALLQLRDSPKAAGNDSDWKRFWERN